AFRAEPSATMRQILRRADHGLHTGLGEGALEHLELGEGGQTGPVDDRDGADLTSVRAAHHGELLACRAKGTCAIALAEGPQRRKTFEDPYQHVVVRHARR